MSIDICRYVVCERAFMFELYSMLIAEAVCAETWCAGLTRFARNQPVGINIQHPTGGAEVSRALWHQCRTVCETVWHQCRNVLVPKCPVTFRTTSLIAATSNDRSFLSQEQCGMMLEIVCQLHLIKMSSW